MLEALQTSSYALRFIELSLVDDSAQGVLNRDFLGVPGPTNILSFPDGETGSLSLDVFAYLREALLYGQEPRVYLIRLLAHGVAHLCGLDHGEEMERLCYILEKAASEKSLTGGRR
ncbi:MAG: rRNA maturation RNAse YbeY [Desulfovibrio sp.]|nr:rRNA maturation RNAse YbeY [Desulfovibrio sp.]